MGSLPSFNAVPVAARSYKKELISALQVVIDRGIFLDGPENTTLEKAFARRLGGFVTTVASGHDALLLTLSTLGLGPGGEVIVPANAYPTAFPTTQSGAKLVLADVDENGQLAPEALATSMTRSTKAVVLVHLYGLVGALEEITLLCRKHRLILIEDCAQAFGSRYKGQPVGSFGDFGCFSFYPTKNLGALGDGGAIRTNSKKFFHYLVAAKRYGERSRFRSDFVSGHSRLPELQAAGLSVYLRHFSREALRRKHVFGWYLQALSAERLGPFVRLLQPVAISDPVPHLLVIEAKNRDSLCAYLDRRGIPTHIHYPIPIHRVAAFSFLRKNRGSYPMAERLAGSIVSLPFHPFLTKADVARIVKTIASFYR